MIPSASERIVRLLHVVSALGDDFHLVVLPNDKPGRWFSIVCGYDAEGDTPEDALAAALELAEGQYFGPTPGGMLQ